jgi:hypothetical protein
LSLNLKFWVFELETKSLYRSRAGKNVIWAGFGPKGNAEKKSLGRL